MFNDCWSLSGFNVSNRLLLILGFWESVFVGGIVVKEDVLNDWALINIGLFTLSVIELTFSIVVPTRLTCVCGSCGCIGGLDIVTEELKADVKSANSSLLSFVFIVGLPNALVKSPKSAFVFWVCTLGWVFALGLKSSSSSLSSSSTTTIDLELFSFWESKISFKISFLFLCLVDKELFFDPDIPFCKFTLEFSI